MTRVFSELQSHYVFADRFGRPGKGNDKGKVEGLIGWIRRNLLVPVPRAISLDALKVSAAALWRRSRRITCNFCVRCRTPSPRMRWDRMLYPHAREAGLFGAPDGRTSINFRVLYQLIKA